jgi:hypothetical protein
LIAEGTLGVVLGSFMAMTLGAARTQYQGRYHTRKRKLEKKRAAGQGLELAQGADSRDRPKVFFAIASQLHGLRKHHGCRNIS